jgi:hypothetical protein
MILSVVTSLKCSHARGVGKATRFKKWWAHQNAPILSSPRGAGDRGGASGARYVGRTPRRRRRRHSFGSAVGARSTAGSERCLTIFVAENQAASLSRTEQGHPTNRRSAIHDYSTRDLELDQRLSWLASGQQLDAARLLSINSQRQQQVFCTLSRTQVQFLL